MTGLECKQRVNRMTHSLSPAGRRGSHKMRIRHWFPFPDAHVVITGNFQGVKTRQTRPRNDNSGRVSKLATLTFSTTSNRNAPGEKRSYTGNDGTYLQFPKHSTETKPPIPRIPTLEQKNPSTNIVEIFNPPRASNFRLIKSKSHQPPRNPNHRSRSGGLTTH